MTLNKSMKPIELFWTRGKERKYPYLCIKGKKSSYPAFYFRKSKWVSDEEFNRVIEFIIEATNDTK